MKNTVGEIKIPKIFFITLLNNPIFSIQFSHFDFLALLLIELRNIAFFNQIKTFIDK